MLTSVTDSPPVPDPVPSQRFWRAGPLVYTTGGLIVLFIWLLWGDFAWSVRDRAAMPIVQLLLKKYNASDTLAGLLMGSLPAILSIIITPVIGYKSDRHRGRWGRRIPFLVIPTPFIVLGMVGLAFCLHIGTGLNSLLGSRTPGNDYCVLLVIALSWTLFEVASVAANSVFNALINDVVPGEVLGRFYAAFRALSLIAGMIVFYWLFGKAENHYLWIFLGIAALYGGGFTLMCLKVKEGKYPDPPPMDPGEAGKGFFAQATAYFQECFGIPYYPLVFVTISLSLQMAMPVTLFSVFYARSLHMDNSVYGQCIAFTFLCSLALAYPLGVLADRFHPLRLGLIVQILYGGVCLWGALYIHDAWTFAVALVLNGVLNGTWNTVMASIYQRLLPKAKFAQFASAAGIVSSILAMILGPSVGVFLDHAHHVYRYTFFLSFILTVVCLVLGFCLHTKFMKLGGPKSYVAPQGTINDADC